MKKLFTALAMAIVAIFVITGATAAYADTMNQVANQNANDAISAIFSPDTAIAGINHSYAASAAVGVLSNLASDAASDKEVQSQMDQRRNSGDIIDQPSATEMEVTYAAAFDYAVMGGDEMVEKDLVQMAAAIDTPAREPDHPAAAMRAAHFNSGELHSTA